MSKLSLSKLFDPKNMQQIVTLLTLLIALWMVMFAIPQLFVSLFDTLLGNMVLVGLIVLTAMYNSNAALGLAIIFMVLFRFSHMGSVKYY